MFNVLYAVLCKILKKGLTVWICSVSVLLQYMTYMNKLVITLLSLDFSGDQIPAN